MLTLIAITTCFRITHFDLISGLWSFLMALEARFNAAVKVIQSLPKDGPYQPANSTKLRFYGLYKQATEGRANSDTKPSLFNVIGRAKWESWNKIGDLDKDEAMTAYIEELKQIIETMSFTGEAQNFLDAIGPFYEFVNLEGDEMGHIKTALDTWASSSSSLSDSGASSTNNSPLKNLMFEGLQNLKSSQEALNKSPVTKMNGHLPNPNRDDSESPRSHSPSTSFTAPPAPVHRASLIAVNKAGLTNGLPENDNSDEVLEIDEVSHEYQIHHEGKVSVESLQSGTESDKYYSGDSEPEVDAELSSSVGFVESPGELNASHLSNNIGTGVRHRRKQKNGSYQDEGIQGYSGIGMNTILEARQSPEFILHNTVERLNRDVDHILARIRILETAYAANGPIVGGSQLRRKRFFGELSGRSLTLIFSWPFIAYFIIKLLKWWFLKRRRGI